MKTLIAILALGCLIPLGAMSQRRDQTRNSSRESREEQNRSQSNNGRNDEYRNKNEHHQDEYVAHHSHYQHKNNHYNNSYYYGDSHCVVRPAIGYRMAVLPPQHRVIVYNGFSFYYASGVFYREVARNCYEVSEPMVGAVVPELPMDFVDVVEINRVSYYVYDGILYQPIVTRYGVQYEVKGRLSV